MVQLASPDQRIKAMWPPFQKPMSANDKDYETHIYPGLNHGFHEDTTPRDHEAAAILAEQ